MKLFRRCAKTNWWLLLFSLAACSALCQTPARTDTSNTVSLSGRVTGGSGKHAIYVALWSGNGFLKHPVQQVRIAPGAEPDFHFQIAMGRWALSAFEDQNDNGTLDMGFFGPKEPSGFWRPFHAWRKPRFDDVADQVDRDTAGIEIKLGK